MNLEQQHALLAIALLPAFADDHRDDREREQVRRRVDTLGGQVLRKQAIGQIASLVQGR